MQYKPSCHGVKQLMTSYFLFLSLYTSSSILRTVLLKLSDYNIIRIYYLFHACYFLHHPLASSKSQCFPQDPIPSHLQSIFFLRARNFFPGSYNRRVSTIAFGVDCDSDNHFVGRESPTSSILILLHYVLSARNERNEI
jgi:hypothetical protein